MSPISQTYLIRPRIHDLLDKSVQKPVTTIVAGAGYSKTQAVYAYLKENDHVTIWLQLSASDNLTLRLWENFTYAVSLQNKELAEKFSLMGYPESSSSYHGFIDLIATETRNEKYFIVFDDCHLIYEKAILEFFVRFTNSRIPNLSTIFISRREPEINTIGLKSKGVLSNINEDDLRFNENELFEYFQIQGIQLSPKAIKDIYEYTDGWIFAIHLIELSLKKGLPLENYALSAAKENIHRLIESEIFSIASEEMKYFLIKLSLVDQVPLELIKDIFPNDDELISEMTKISSFIRYDTYSHTYRIHHLFLSFLREKQSMLNTDDKMEICAKAANWYAENGYGIDAITYYEKINRYDEIIKIITLSYSMCLPGETNIFILEVLERAAKAMEDGGDASVPELLHARFLIFNAKYEEAYEELIILRKKYIERQNNVALCGVYVLMGFICLMSGSIEFKEFFKMACDTGERLRYRVPVMIGYCACKVISSDKGEFERYIEALIESTVPFTETMIGTGLGYRELATAEYAFLQRDLKNAEKYARQTVLIAQEKQQMYIESMAFFYLIRIKVSLGDYAETVDLLEQLQSRIKSQNSSISYGIFDIISGWFYSSIGHFDKVASWIKSDFVNRETNQSIYGWERLAQAKYKIIKKKYLEALAILELFEDNNIIFGKLIGRIELKILKALSLYYLDDHEGAFANLQVAYDLAYPNSLVMLFVEQGNNMRTLAKAAILSDTCTIPTQWLETILVKSSSYSKRLLHIIAEAKISNQQGDKLYVGLSKREIEVLTDLCDGLTREEIADNCDLSINTVKSMLRSIYSKLGATNTLDAVRIATSMRLIK